MSGMSVKVGLELEGKVAVGELSTWELPDLSQKDTDWIHQAACIAQCNQVVPS